MSAIEVRAKPTLRIIFPSQFMARLSGSHSCDLTLLGPNWRLCRALNEDLQQFIWICFDRPTNLDKFYDVEAPLSAFVFGDK
jgi:hypothetical protein